MSITRALYTTLVGLIPGGASDPKLLYGTAETADPPYYVMLKVSDDEQPDTVCEDQGTQGKAVFQFSCTGINNAGGTEILLETLKVIVAGVIGDIVYNGSVYSVWNNITSGVAPLSGADLNTWDAIFTCEIWWKLKS